MIRRYGIYWVELDPTQGNEINKVRPCVVVSPDVMNRHSGIVVICPITRTLHPEWRTRIPVRCDTKDGEIMVDQIRAVSIDRVRGLMQFLTGEQAESLRTKIFHLYATE